MIMFIDVLGLLVLIMFIDVFGLLVYIPLICTWVFVCCMFFLN